MARDSACENLRSHGYADWRFWLIAFLYLRFELSFRKKLLMIPLILFVSFGHVPGVRYFINGWAHSLDQNNKTFHFSVYTTWVFKHSFLGLPCCVSLFLFLG